MAPESARESFCKQERLRRSDDIKSVLVQGRKYSSGGVQLFLLARAGQTGTRVGFIVKRKLGGACLRNLMKRRMREAYRRLKRNVRPGCDLVLSATRELDYRTVERELGTLFGQSGA
jgi:ribonuclease P protein component